MEGDYIAGVRLTCPGLSCSLKLYIEMTALLKKYTSESKKQRNEQRAKRNSI